MHLSFENIPQELMGEIQLPASKSISNRLLTIQAFSKKEFEIQNLSDSEDTQVMQKILAEWNLGNAKNKFNVGHTGTAMRFLTSFFASQQGKVVELSGSERMHKRPIGILVEALENLGADIKYEGRNNYPPLLIVGKNLIAEEKILIDGNVSSQYISSILMLGAFLKNGLEIELLGNTTSEPYIDMTLGLLNYFGIKSEKNFNHIKISPSVFIPKKILVESDWSAASYFFSLLALSPSGKLVLKNLSLNSLQGDVVLINYFEKFGIGIEQKENDLWIHKENFELNNPHFNLMDCPDLAQTLIVCAAGLKMNSTYSGLETLRLKETDRIKALQKELNKFGIRLEEHHEIFELNCDAADFSKEVIVETYQDHRMAMAFAPLVFKNKKIKIKNPNVVKKSYPNFWKDLSILGIHNNIENVS